MIDEERQQRDRTIAERYALQHRHDAQIPQSPVASHYVAQPVNAESDKEYQDGALCNDIVLQVSRAILFLGDFSKE